MEYTFNDQQQAMMGDPAAAKRVTGRKIILRCPRCGSYGRYKVESHVSSGISKGFKFRIGCVKCSCSTRLYDIKFDLDSFGKIVVVEDDRDKALLDWNTRPNITRMEDVKNGN